MIKLCGEVSLVQFIDREHIDSLPQQRKILIARPDDSMVPDLDFARVRMAGGKSRLEEGQIVIVSAGRPGSRLEFEDILKTGETLYLLKDGDIIAEIEDEEA